MKRAFITVLLLLTALTGYTQQNQNLCRIGIDYELSQDMHWGTGMPVITHVIPYSPAELAGVKPHDIIIAIDGIETIDISKEEISELLNPSGKNEILLTIGNLSTPSKQILVKKECKKAQSITEDQLAMAFSMYSLETAGEREFICPFKTTVTEDPIDFRHFKTFAFSAPDEENYKLESDINESIENELTKKGMKVDVDNPDILIQTFYYFDKNPDYRGSNRLLVEKEPVYRFTPAGKWIKMPFLSSKNAESEAEFVLQLGFRMIDQRDEPGRILWECESNELLEDTYRLDEYARIHIPLMCLQYPYVKYTKSLPILVSQLTYNYTGVSYNIDEMERIAEVDKNSPAYAAGLRARDVVERINGLKADGTPESYSSAYKNFITQTLKYRDVKTVFTDANGFKRCMYWDPLQYIQVSESFQKNSNKALFSYLYYYAPYINPTGNNVCIFEVTRGKNKMEIAVRPTIRRSLTIQVK